MIRKIMLSIGENLWHENTFMGQKLPFHRKFFEKEKREDLSENKIEILLCRLCGIENDFRNYNLLR